MGYGPASDEKDALVTLKKAVEIGSTFIDTAVVYVSRTSFDVSSQEADASRPAAGRGSQREPDRDPVQAKPQLPREGLRRVEVRLQRKLSHLVSLCISNPDV